MLVSPSLHPIARAARLTRESVDKFTANTKQTAQLWRTGRRKSCPETGKSALVSLGLQDLTPAIFAGFQVDMVGSAQFARLFILDIGCRRDGIVATPHAPPRRCDLTLWYGHDKVLTILRCRWVGVGQSMEGGKRRPCAAQCPI